MQPQTPVEVCLLFVQDAMPHYGRLFALLTADEQARAARYLRAETREEFVAARASLRLLLGRALQTPAADVHLIAGDQGKLQTAGIAFNLSHSGGLVAVALSQRASVGIDVEKIDRRVEVLDVAEASFSASEVAQLRGMASVEAQRQRFFELWTEQEAVAQCLGIGLVDAMHKDVRAGLHARPFATPPGYLGCICTPASVEVSAPEVLTSESIRGLFENVPRVRSLGR